jgi:hypothetical protein
MPSTSVKQHRFMEAIAHNKDFAKKAGVPQSVGKDFSAADKGKKFATGGVTRGGKGMINRQETRWGSVLGAAKGAPDVNLNKFEGKKEGGLMKKMAKDGMGMKMAKDGMGMGMAKGGKAKVKKMAAGGMTSMGKVTAGGKRPHGEHSIQEKGHTKGKNIAMSRGGKC